MSVFLDLSQLLADPARTGIQRVERELIRHWPGPAPLTPCWFDPGAGSFRQLPRSVLDALQQEHEARLPPLRSGAAVPEEATLLCMELFADARRAAAYQSRDPARLAWLVYDFLPWLHPDWFPPGGACTLMPYLRALRLVPRVAFISEQTRADYRRVVRRAPGPVIPLGGDGLRLERQHFGPDRDGFVFLGTLEPRKNGALVLRAFERLWAEGSTATLTLIGKRHASAVAEQELLGRLDHDPRLRVLDRAPDSAVRAVLRRARAMVFPSEGEGFGIPPVEALQAGVPVIVAASLPSLHDQPDAGQIRLDPVTEETVLAAIRRLLDDAEAERLWEAAATLRIPSWRDFAQGLADWVQAG